MVIGFLFRHYQRPPSGMPRAAWFGVFVLLAAAAMAAPTAPPTRLVMPPSPTPPPPAPAEIEVAPPLSIFESCQLLSDTARVLAGPSAPTTATLRQIDRQLYTIILYVDRVDRAHPTLPFYAWEGISSEKAPKAGWETQTFKLAQPIPQVTAISIHARHGDVEIKYLAAIDRNNTRWEFNQLIRVPAEQPRPEICFLPLPTELAQILVTCRRANPKTQPWARLFLDAGVCGIPESAKQAVYYLQVARADLKKNRIIAARRHIREAYEFLREYQKNRRF